MMEQQDAGVLSNGQLSPITSASSSPASSASFSATTSPSSSLTPSSSYLTPPTQSFFPVSPSPSFLSNGEEGITRRGGSVIVGRRDGRLASSGGMMSAADNNRKESNDDTSLSSLQVRRGQNSLHHSLGSGSLSPTHPHATFSMDVIDTEKNTRARTSSEEDAAPRRRAWAASTKRSSEAKAEPVTGDALTQKRSLISAKPQKPRGRLSAEFESENTQGRARKASFAEHRLLHNRSEEILAEAVSAPAMVISAVGETLIRQEEVYLEGWLTKINADQRRWFVLTNENFAYYKDENTSGVEPRIRVHREELKRVSRSMAGMESGNNTTRRAHNALLRMVKTPRTRKKITNSASTPDNFGSAVSPSRNTKSQQSPTTGSEKNLHQFIPNFFILTSCPQERAFALATDDCVETAVWMLALGGISQRDLSNPSESPLDENERRELLRYLHFEGYKGGILKTSWEEEWHYWPKGLIKSDRGVDQPISYTWDGECFNPVLKGDEQNFGRGKWNGVWIEWYPPGSSVAVVKYQWHPVAREYRTDRASDNWKWTRHFLASTSGRGEWIMEGEIPEIVVMMLQLLVYARERPEMRTPPGAVGEGMKKEEDIIKNRLKDFEVMGVTDSEIERLLQLRKLSENRKQRSSNNSTSESAISSSSSPVSSSSTSALVVPEITNHTPNSL